MKIWVFDDNLFWSTRLIRSLTSLGHEAVVLALLPQDGSRADVALINLSSRRAGAPELVPALRDRGIHTIGFAGHKETELLELGRQAGCDEVATNSKVSFNLAAVLAHTFPQEP